MMDSQTRSELESAIGQLAELAAFAGAAQEPAP